MNTLIIAVTGPSGAGKSTFTNALSGALSRRFPGSHVAVIHEDAYYREQSHLTLAQRQLTDYDQPAALEHSLLLTHLRALLDGKAVDVPVYDYALHTRSSMTRQQTPADVLILEGILLFSNPHLLRMFDLRLFIHTPLEHCLQRRIARDTQERGRSCADVEAQFARCVVPMYHTYRDVWQRHADLVIDGECPTETALPAVLHRLDAVLAGKAAAGTATKLHAWMGGDDADSGASSPDIPAAIRHSS